MDGKVSRSQAKLLMVAMWLERVFLPINLLTDQNP